MPPLSVRKLARCVLLLSLALWLPACGYTLRHRLKESFRKAPGLFVPVFTNQTYETGAERVFTDALIRELQSRGEVVLTSREEGGMEMRGELAGLRYGPTALTVPAFQGLQSVSASSF